MTLIRKERRQVVESTKRTQMRRDLERRSSQRKEENQFSYKDQHTTHCGAGVRAVPGRLKGKGTFDHKRIQTVQS